MLGRCAEFLKYIKSRCDDKRSYALAHEAVNGIFAFFGRKTEQVVVLHLSDYLNAQSVKVVEKSGKLQAGTVDLFAVDEDRLGFFGIIDLFKLKFVNDRIKGYGIGFRHVF